MDINVTLKIESPEIMASILALAESMTEMKLKVKHYWEEVNNKNITSQLENREIGISEDTKNKEVIENIEKNPNHNVIKQLEEPTKYQLIEHIKEISKEEVKEQLEKSVISFVK